MEPHRYLGERERLEPGARDTAGCGDGLLEKHIHRLGQPGVLVPARGIYEQRGADPQVLDHVDCLDGLVEHVIGEMPGFETCRYDLLEHQPAGGVVLDCPRAGQRGLQYLDRPCGLSGLHQHARYGALDIGSILRQLPQIGELKRAIEKRDRLAGVTLREIAASDFGIGENAGVNVGGLFRRYQGNRERRSLGGKFLQIERRQGLR